MGVPSSSSSPLSSHAVFALAHVLPAAPTRAAADPGGSAPCACHEICTKPRAAHRRPRAPQLTLCTAPATKSALQAHQVLRLPRTLHCRFTKWCTCHEIYTQPHGACHEIYTPGSPTLQVHQVLHLPRNLYSATRRLAHQVHCRFTKCCACREICTQPHAAHAAQRRPRAPQLIREALRTAPAIKSTLQANQVLRLPRNLHCKFTKYGAADPTKPTPGSPSTAPATKPTLQVHPALRLPRNLY